MDIVPRKGKMGNLFAAGVACAVGAASAGGASYGEVLQKSNHRRTRSDAGRAESGAEDGAVVTKYETTTSEHRRKRVLCSVNGEKVYLYVVEKQDARCANVRLTRSFPL